MCWLHLRQKTKMLTLFLMKTSLRSRRFRVPLSHGMEMGLLGYFNICWNLLHTCSPITGNLRPGSLKKTG